MRVSRGSGLSCQCDFTLEKMKEEKQNIVFLLAAFLTIVLLVILAHGTSLKNSFYFDDAHILINNQAVRSLENIPRFFYDISTSSCDYNNYQFRPIVTLSYALNYAAGGLEPYGYHIVNLLIHILCGLLVFLIIKKLILRWGDISKKYAILIAFSAAAFFIVAPQNVETINYCSARSSSFATLFYLLGFWIYLYARERHVLLYLPVALCMILGLMSKDIIGSFPVLLIFYEYWERGRKNYHNPKYDNYRKAVPWIFLGLILLLYISRGIFLVGGERFANQFSGGLADKIATQSRAHLHYISQFLIPGDFPIDPIDFGFSKLSDPRSIAAVFTLLGFALFIFGGRKKMPLLTFGLLWYFLALSPSSGIANTTQPINYHRPYIAIPGLCCAAAAVFIYLKEFFTNKFNGKTAGIIIVWLILSILFWNVILSREQNKIWNDKTKLWEIAVKCSPSSGRAHLNLGLRYMSENKFDDAEREYKKCIELWPGYPYAYINLGILFEHRGKRIKADECFLNAYNIWPEHKVVVKYFTKHLLKRKRYKKAINVLNKVIDSKPESAPFRLIRGKCYYYLGDNYNAISDFNYAAKYIPPERETVLYMCVTFDKLKKYDDMLILINKWMEKNAPDNKILYNKAYALMRLGKYEEAIREWEKYIRKNSGDSAALKNLDFCKRKLREN